MPPLFDTSRIRMTPRDETAEMAQGLNFHEGLPSQAPHVGQPAFIRAHLIERLTARLGFDKSDAHALVDAFFELIMQALENGDAIRLSGFGCFRLRDQRARPGRNPKTGAAVPVTARRVVLFRASRNLKFRLCDAKNIPTRDCAVSVSPWSPHATRAQAGRYPDRVTTSAEDSLL
jgi:integration host factor subunit alpha